MRYSIKQQNLSLKSLKVQIIRDIFFLTPRVTFYLFKYLFLRLIGLEM